MTNIKIHPDSPTIRLGVSACLLGEKVRFDANHKLDTYIRDTLGQYFEFVPVCPEVAIGLGVPRPTIRLVGDPARPRAVGVLDPGRDVTEALENYGRRMAQELPPLAGYLLKSKSPSCGMERVKVSQDKGVPKLGRGLYAAALMAGRPPLPVEEEGRLGDPVLRENFIERVFCYHRWQQLEAQGLTPARLVDFHARHKLVLMSHGAEYYHALGRLVAQAGSTPIAALAQEYIHGFMAALARPATRKRHTNVLQHLMGYLKKQLDSADKAELLEIIEAYRLGEVPLIVPVTLLNHHFRRHPDEYVAQQVYLAPHPRELMLRNHI
jgi:uncharacterized protein YbgA (DUF1722 family)/uncharacterized protein YbbK (DUF523 family)